MLKKEGELCGPHMGGDEGNCESGLKCHYDPRIRDGPGTCIVEGKVYPKLMNNITYQNYPLINLDIMILSFILD